MTVSQMLAHIVSASPDGIVVVDTFNDVVYANDRATELGIVRDRLLDDRAWRAAEQVFATGQAVDVDLSPRKLPHPGRSGISVRGWVRLLSAEDRRFAVVYADDQSEHARMEATRRDFVANVSHELKTPVGAMRVLAEALQASSDDPDMVRRFSDKMVAESLRLADMVGELIELSRLQGAERLPDLGAVDVDTVVSEALSRHKVAADKADISITTDAATGYRVLGDQNLLVTAVANLVSNAIAYSPNGSGISISRVGEAAVSRSRSPTAVSESPRPIRNGSSSGSSGSTRRAPAPPVAPASAWRSSNMWPPTTTEPSGCGVSRAPDRLSLCRFRPIPKPMSRQVTQTTERISETDDQRVDR